MSPVRTECYCKERCRRTPTQPYMSHGQHSLDKAQSDPLTEIPYNLHIIPLPKSFDHGSDAPRSSNHARLDHGGVSMDVEMAQALLGAGVRLAVML